MTNCWLVLLPPIIVLALALLTKNVIISLLSGIFTACLIATNCNGGETLSLMFKQLYQQTDIPNLLSLNGEYGHLYTLGFLIVLGILIQLMTHSGGMHAYTTAISKIIHKARSAQLTSLGISSTFFLDDYFNTYTAGAIMRPLFDKFYLPRAKLAFLLNSMSGPLCLLVPASSWVAFILGQFSSNGLSTDTHIQPLILADPFSVYLQMIPYLFYPILIIFSAWFIIYRPISYGAMHSFEKIATETGNLFGGKAPLHQHEPETQSLATHKGTLSLFFIPLGTFLAGVPLTALRAAGWNPFGGEVYWYQAFQSAKVINIALFSASMLALIAMLIYVIAKQIFPARLYGKIVLSGINLIKNSLILLLLTWTFGEILQTNLQTGNYVAALVMSYVPLFIIPCALFIVSTLVSAATGSSWGTVSIMLPICIPTLALLTGHTPALIPEMPLLLPSIGAILSGIVAGSHISPISDATIVASNSVQCYHIDHVQTQAAYSLPAILAATLGFLALPLVGPSLGNSLLALGAAVVFTTAILLMRNKNRV